MNLTEKKKKIDDRTFNLEQQLEKKYKKVFDIFGKKCFKAREDEFFSLTRLQWANAIVVEHAFSLEEAKKNMFEDGDLFYLDELNEEQMLEKMIEEIEE